MTDSENQTFRLFVGGLFPSISKDELRDRFKSFGSVTDVELIERKDDKGDILKTFGYVSLSSTQQKVSRCFALFGGTKWKGHELKVQLAKENFIARLEKERSDPEYYIKKKSKKKQVEPVRSYEELIEISSKMRRAVPGTPIEGERNWVIGKFGRPLPVVFIPPIKGRKPVKVDPSKHCHCLKKIADDSSNDMDSMSNLTWYLEDSNNNYNNNIETQPVKKLKKKKKRKHSTEESSSDVESHIEVKHTREKIKKPKSESPKKSKKVSENLKEAIVVEELKSVADSSGQRLDQKVVQSPKKTQSHHYSDSSSKEHENKNIETQNIIEFNSDSDSGSGSVTLSKHNLSISIVDQLLKKNKEAESNQEKANNVNKTSYNSSGTESDNDSTNSERSGDFDNCFKISLSELEQLAKNGSDDSDSDGNANKSLFDFDFKTLKDAAKENHVDDIISGKHNKKLNTQHNTEDSAAIIGSNEASSESETEIQQLAESSKNSSGSDDAASSDSDDSDDNDDAHGSLFDFDLETLKKAAKNENQRDIEKIFEDSTAITGTSDTSSESDSEEEELTESSRNSAGSDDDAPTGSDDDVNESLFDFDLETLKKAAKENNIKDLKTSDRHITDFIYSSESSSESEAEQETSTGKNNISINNDDIQNEITQNESKYTPLNEKDLLKKHRKSEKARKKSLDVRNKKSVEHKEVVNLALKNIDSSVSTSNRIVFDDDNDDDNCTDASKIKKEKKKKKKKKNLPDNNSDDGKSTENPMSTNEKSSNKKAEKLSLFDDSESNEDGEDDEGDDEISAFKVKSQFQGDEGAKLFKLQQKFGGDERFRMDEKFAAVDDDNDNQSDDNAERYDEDIPMEVDDNVTEKNKNLSILEQVLEKSLIPLNKEKMRDKTFERYDPSKEDHDKFEIKPEENTKDNDSDDENESDEKKQINDDSTAPTVSTEQFYDVDKSIKSLFTSTVEEPSKTTFSFLGNDPNADNEQETAQNQEQTIKDSHKSLSWKKALEEAANIPEEDVEEINKMNVTENLNQDGYKFFFTPEDERFEKAKNFIRTDSIEDITEQWKSMRSELFQACKKRHKDAVRRVRKLKERKFSTK